MNKPIGIFDSGVGGLTVLKAIHKILPHERLVYLGDTARVPYGNKSRDTIIRYSIENSNFLLSHDIKLLVVACNTSTATSMDTLLQRFSVPIIGVIDPGSRRAVAVTRTNRIGVIGTEATVKSKAYETIMKSIKKNVTVFSKPCPLFVPLVEEGLVRGAMAENVVEHYLKSFKSRSIDTIVLGCTHYPLLKGVIKKFFRNKVSIVDSAEETAKTVKQLLAERDILCPGKTTQTPEFFVTDAAKRFLKVGKTILGKDMSAVSLVKVGT